MLSRSRLLAFRRLGRGVARFSDRHSARKDACLSSLASGLSDSSTKQRIFEGQRVVT